MIDESYLGNERADEETPEGRLFSMDADGSNRRDVSYLLAPPIQKGLISMNADGSGMRDASYLLGLPQEDPVFHEDANGKYVQRLESGGEEPLRVIVMTAEGIIVRDGLCEPFTHEDPIIQMYEDGTPFP